MQKAEGPGSGVVLRTCPIVQVPNFGHFTMDLSLRLIQPLASPKGPPTWDLCSSTHPSHLSRPGPESSSTSPLINAPICALPYPCPQPITGRYFRYFMINTVVFPHS
jgi:hypothetical protein